MSISGRGRSSSDARSGSSPAQPRGRSYDGSIDHARGEGLGQAYISNHVLGQYRPNAPRSMWGPITTGTVKQVYDVNRNLLRGKHPGQVTTISEQEYRLTGNGQWDRREDYGNRHVLSIGTLVGQHRDSYRAEHLEGTGS